MSSVVAGVSSLSSSSLSSDSASVQQSVSTAFVAASSASAASVAASASASAAGVSDESGSSGARVSGVTQSERERESALLSFARTFASPHVPQQSVLYAEHQRAHAGIISVPVPVYAYDSLVEQQQQQQQQQQSVSLLRDSDASTMTTTVAASAAMSLDHAASAYQLEAPPLANGTAEVHAQARRTAVASGGLHGNASFSSSSHGVAADAVSESDAHPRSASSSDPVLPESAGREVDLNDVGAASGSGARTTGTRSLSGGPGPSSPHDTSDSASAGLDSNYEEFVPSDELSAERRRKLQAVCNNRRLNISVYLPGGAVAKFVVSANDLVGRLREMMAQDSMVVSAISGDLGDYVFRAAGLDDFLDDDTVDLLSSSYIRTCIKMNISIHLSLVERAKVATQLARLKSTASGRDETGQGYIGRVTFLEKNLVAVIASLIGARSSWSTETQEARSFRYKMEQLRRREVQQRQRQLMRFPNWVSFTPVPAGYPTLIEVRFHLSKRDIQFKTLRVDATQRVADVMEFVLTRIQRVEDVPGPACRYIFKAVGYDDYMYGNYALIDYDYIRQSLLKHTDIELVLAERDEVEMGLLEYDEDVTEEPEHEEEFAFAQVDVRDKPWERWTHIPVWELANNFRVRIVALEGLRFDDPSRVELFEKYKITPGNMELHVTADLYHGGRKMAESRRTPFAPAQARTTFGDWLEFRIAMRDVPRNCRLCLSMWASSSRGGASKKARVALGWVNCQLMDDGGIYRSGFVSLKLWPNDHANPIGTCVENLAAQRPSTIHLEFERYALPVIFPPCELPQCYFDEVGYTEPAEREPDEEEAADIDMLIRQDPLYVLTDGDEDLLWSHAEYCAKHPKSLPKLLRSVPWNNRFAVAKIHRLIKQWTPLSPWDVLELLDANYADDKVREYAVARIDTLDDNDLIDVMLQLCQVLKYEAYHDSALARMIITRSLRAPRRVGHVMFWHLKAEMHLAHIAERYGLILEAYLRGCGAHRRDLMQQNDAQQKLISAAMAIKTVPDKQRKAVLWSELEKIEFAKQFQLPLDPRWSCCTLNVQKCKYMDSKKLPLWLNFRSSDALLRRSMLVIFKAGDDLRQDVLTLQLIRIMDKLWQQEGLDLQMRPYIAVATGNEIGMLEVVCDAETTSRISKDIGGARAAFSEEPLAVWLRQKNPSDEAYKKAVETFMLSCAGYCMATYVLGIGDRHNDNIMMTRFGHLFHIDFGHFLGNFKKWWIFKRETAPFVLTPAYAYVMGGRNSEMFEQFVQTCIKAFLILRKYAHLFINLFAMMLSTGMPELQKPEDIDWLRRAFSLDATEEAAGGEIRKLVNEALEAKATQWNHYIHNLAH